MNAVIKWPSIYQCLPSGAISTAWPQIFSCSCPLLGLRWRLPSWDPAWMCLDLMDCFLICDSFIKNPPFRIIIESCINLLIGPDFYASCFLAKAGWGWLGHLSWGTRRVQWIEPKAQEVGDTFPFLPLLTEPLWAFEFPSETWGRIKGTLCRLLNMHWA